MRFLLDAQLPPGLARVFRDAGHLCDHVDDLGMLGASDLQIWRFAEAYDAVIVTKDEDFSSRKTLQRGPPSVVWLRVGNCSNRALIRWLAPLMPTIFERLEKGEELIEVV